MSATSMRWILLILLILGLLLMGACGQARQPGDSSLVIDINPNRATSLVVDDGVRIEIDNALDVVANFRTGEGTVVSIDGQRLTVSAGKLRLGERSYGEVAPGDDVQIDAEGVRVGDASRGELP